MRKFYQHTFPNRHIVFLQNICCSDRLEVCFFAKECLYFSERTLRLLQSPFHHPETRKSDDTQRLTWSSALFVEDSMYIDWDNFSLHIVIYRQSSSMTRNDQHGRLHFLSKTPCLSIETTLVSISSSKDNQVWWHTEINMVVSILCRRLHVYRLRLL